MTHEGRMARGKVKFDAGDTTSSEVKYYLDCKSQAESKKEAVKPKKEKKDAKPRQ